METAIVLIVVICIVVRSFSRKQKSKRDREVFKEQVLSVFTENKKFAGQDISELLEERTGRPRRVLDSEVYIVLDELASEEKLLKVQGDGPYPPPLPRYMLP